MISNVDIEKILLLTLKQRQKAIIIGDFDIKRRELYQLKPIKDAPFFYIFDNKNNIILSSANKWVPEKDIFYKHLTQNRRQGADLNFNKFLKNMRGKENNYIKQSILNNPMFKKISFDDALKKYKLGDKILCSTNEEINKANKNMNLEGDQIQILYKATLGGHAKNETAIINKNEYNDLIMKLGYAQTAHSAQGQTYNNNIFISINRLFTDNLLYVMLSRTKTSEQIYIIDH